MLLLPAAARAQDSAVFATAATTPQRAGASPLTTIGSLRFWTIPIPAGVEPPTFVADLRAAPTVFAAVLDSPVSIANVANLCAPAPPAPALGLPVAVDARTQPLPASTGAIAILDTGVDPAAPELAGRVLPDVLASDGTFSAPDENGHGTEVAAAAAAAPGLFAGVSPTSPILPVRTYDQRSQTRPSWTVRGIAGAVRRKARVIVLAPPGPLTEAVANADATVLGLAVTAAFRQGVITVVAAGDQGTGYREVPATLPRTITVGFDTATGFGQLSVARGLTEPVRRRWLSGRGRQLAGAGGTEGCSSCDFEPFGDRLTPGSG